MIKKKNQKGFTLVELLVVIAIIGILAVVAVPALFKNINKAKVADLESDYSAIKSAVLSYYTENNTLPESSVTDLAEHMDSVPVKSALGDGAYSLKEEADKAYYLIVGSDKVECSNSNHSAEHTDDECKPIEVTGANLTVEQLKKLYKDIGNNKVYVGEIVINDDDAAEENAGEKVNLKIKLIDNVDM